MKYPISLWDIDAHIDMYGFDEEFSNRLLKVLCERWSDPSFWEKDPDWEIIPGGKMKREEEKP
jgi:hypothetical protein